ncbi:MAG: zinc-binding alcohol dehydrogenase family protein [Planctomycetota bacterium]|nr:zinc-binding alcohol dehydrogenase family protein [Planctomycetota bacterium]
MKAIVLEKPEVFRAVEMAEPGRPGCGEALVRVHRVGICGSDVGGYLGKMPFFKYPRIPGHELGVEVLEVGEGVANVKGGDWCSVEPYMNCGKCIACRKGRGNCCANLNVIGVMIDGGMRERFILRADKLHVGRKLTFDQLALVETLAIGCHAVDRAGVQRGENVLIVGAGPIGLAALEFVKIAGAKSIMMDVAPQRVEFAKRVMGADVGVVLSEGLERELREVTGGDLPDVVIDATGNAKSMSSAFGYVAPTGRLVFVGITTGEVVFKHPVFHRPEGTLLCSRNALPGDFGRIIGLLGEGRINTEPWITHQVGVDELIGEFVKFTKPETGVIKAMVRM